MFSKKYPQKLYGLLFFSNNKSLETTTGWKLPPVDCATLYEHHTAGGWNFAAKIGDYTWIGTGSNYNDKVSKVKILPGKVQNVTK